MNGFPERWIIILPRCLPAEKFPTFASGRQGRGPVRLLGFHHQFHLTRLRDVAGGRITGIRGWICATSSLGSPVIIVQVRSHSADSGSFQPSQRPAKVNGRPSFMAKSERQLRSGGFSPFIKAVSWDHAAAFSESLLEGRRLIDRLGSGVDRPVSDLWIFSPVWN
jgi:hypothetical protein